MDLDRSREGALSEEDVYFSVDVETDGPIPGEYSLLSFAIVEAGIHNGVRYLGPEEPETGYWELKPISDKFEHEALEVNRLDRTRLARDGDTPEVAMRSAAEWIRNRSSGRRPVMVASPVGFDWMFMHWYFVRYCGASPFGYSSGFDLKTAISVRFDRPVAQSGRSSIPRWMESHVPHSHDPRDDALKQAQEFQAIREWQGIGVEL
ncbi:MULTISPECIES: hypothetical protein [unclassified Leifsonia]|uniref:hypothetical protein n=1 Tax=unclassified Leifsonia TaxID=2663824 RepID=UPI0009DAE4E8|nr:MULTISPECIES: hypothetical protein [unclassified Leifsonia]TDP99352.1 hypothetical protein AXZ95_3270 [Leifsonia sp. 115AMFTsu3.1]